MPVIQYGVVAEAKLEYKVTYFVDVDVVAAVEVAEPESLAVG